MFAIVHDVTSIEEVMLWRWKEWRDLWNISE